MESIFWSRVRANLVITSVQIFLLCFILYVGCVYFHFGMRAASWIPGFTERVRASSLVSRLKQTWQSSSLRAKSHPSVVRWRWIRIRVLLKKIIHSTVSVQSLYCRWCKVGVVWRLFRLHCPPCVLWACYLTLVFVSSTQLFVWIEQICSVTAEPPTRCSLSLSCFFVTYGANTVSFNFNAVPVLRLLTVFLEND